MSVGRRLVTSLCIAFPLLTAAPVPDSGAAAASPPGPIGGANAAGADPAAEPCGAELLLEAQLARDPELAARRELFEAMLREARAKGLVPPPGLGAAANPIYTIPVAVHIVHDGGPENISYAQVLSQIAAINRDAQNLPGNPFPAADCQMQFCLATNLPSGSSVQWASAGQPGVTRKQDAAATVVQFGNPASDAALKAINYLPSNQYLNVWVVKQIAGGGGGIIGYATFPGTVAPTLDGIVMDYRVMGANGVGYGTFPALSIPTYDEGKVFAHEVGHWLNLYHTFHAGCSPGDLVADTPPEAVNRTGCPSVLPTSCGNNGDPIHNFMDYTNDPCRYEFTAGQRDRMHAAIAAYRSELVSPANLVATGACPPALYAVVTASPSQACVNDPVQLSAPNCGTCTYSWSFPGGAGATSGQFTTVTYATPGAHTVTLTMTDGSAVSTATAVVYVAACTPVTGPCTNWVWGSRCRLSFASGLPVAVAGTQNLGPECGAQISDASGALLFYTDNKEIWNANNAVMLNGTDLIGGRSSHTGALILPRPGSPTQYFLFTIREWEDGPHSNPLHVTTVDMTLDGGLGGVVVAEKNVPITLPGGAQSPKRLLEGMTLIPHCNATDWWLITHGADTDWSGRLYVTLVTSAGAGPSVAYPIGMGGMGGNYTAWGTVTASRGGTKIAVCRANNPGVDASGGKIRVYDFDRATGVPTLALDTGNIGANQDVAFSPNGKLVYYCYLKSGTNNSYGLRQMDLATQQVRTLTTPVGVGGDLDVELGPDGRIYVARAGHTALHCVNYPDNFNTFDLNECGLNPYAVPLGPGAMVTLTGALPNTLPICSASAPPAQFTYSITNCYTVTFRTPNCGPWNWTFGDGNTSAQQSPQHTYANPGTYNVTLNAPNASPSTVTIPVTIGTAPVSIAGSSSACGGPFNYSAVGPASYVYTWTITGGAPATATGNNVFVSWGLGGGVVQLTATDPATGCTSVTYLALEPCATCVEPPLDMVAWWPLDETSGPLAQEIVAARDGQDVNAPAKVPGAASNCRQFNGASQLVGVDDDPQLDLGTGDLTLDAWINTASGAPLQSIVEKRALSPDRGYALYLKQGRLALSLGDGSAGTEHWASGSASLADGNWHHVAATVDRSDAAAGTRLYVDGAPVAVFPGYPPAADLDNAEKLLIGARGPSGAPQSHFAGMIDEVEIYNRALTGEEVAGIWGAGPAGKCKEFTYVPSGTPICAGQSHALVTVQVCNLGTSPQSFNLSFTGLSGQGCAGAGPTTFQMQGQNNPVAVPAGTCKSVVVKIDDPGGLAQGDFSCYAVTATNVSSSVAHVSRGSIWANETLCPRLQSSGLSWTGVGVTVAVTYQVSNRSASDLTVPLTVVARSADGAPVGPGGAISLAGLPPGEPWVDERFVAAGDSALVTVEAAFVRPAPFRFFDVVLTTDADADGVSDSETAAGLLYSGRPLQIVGVPPLPAPGTLALLDVTPNPFRRAATVAFELPRAGRVKLALYDVGGRRVRGVADGPMAAGRASRTVHAAGLPSGVYFLRLELEGAVRTRRVVLLRD